MFEIGKRGAWTLGGTLTAAAACVLVVAVLVAGGLVISAAAWVFSALAYVANNAFVATEYKPEMGELFLHGPSFWLVRFSWVLYAVAMAIAAVRRLALCLGLDGREAEGFLGFAEGLSVFAARAAVACSCAAFAAPCVRDIFIHRQDMVDYVPIAVTCVVAALLIARATFWISGMVAANGNCVLLHAFILPLASGLLAMPLAVAGTFGGVVASVLIANLPVIIALIIAVCFLPFFLAVNIRI